MANYTNFQHNLPVFVLQREPLVYKGNPYKNGSSFPWQELDVSPETVETLFKAQVLYHNPALEKEQKVGDRLSEMSKTQLDTLVMRLNEIVKKKTSSTTEFRSKKCKLSKLEDKQKGLLRQFLNRNPWIMDDFYEIRDSILGD